MHKFSFEKLDVWQRSSLLVKEIYRLVKVFPGEEKYGMASQLRRAAVSVSNNLAEGSARKTKKDQSNFTTMSYSSLMEVLNMLILANELEYIHEKDYLKLRPLVEEIANKLNALRNAQQVS